MYLRLFREFEFGDEIEQVLPLDRGLGQITNLEFPKFHCLIGHTSRQIRPTKDLSKWLVGQNSDPSSLEV